MTDADAVPPEAAEADGEAARSAPLSRRPLSRREVLRWGLCAFAGSALLHIAARTPIRGGGWVWQIDPGLCVQCGRCAMECVLAPSAVKCAHAFSLCGYCDLCFGYFPPEASTRDEGAENQLCPTGAIVRRRVEDPYFEYTIDEALCIGCGRCVKGCNAFGNGSLRLQVRHDRCLGCNECAIARACPSGAFRRVPAASPSLLEGGQGAPAEAAS